MDTIPIGNPNRAIFFVRDDISSESLTEDNRINNQDAATPPPTISRREFHDISKNNPSSRAIFNSLFRLFSRYQIKLNYHKFQRFIKLRIEGEKVFTLDLYPAHIPEMVKKKETLTIIVLREVSITIYSILLKLLPSHEVKRQSKVQK